MSAPTIDLDALLRRLHLPTVRRLYPELVPRAEADELSYRDFLAVLFAEEVAHRAQTRIQRCVRRARFPFLKTIEEFDFTFQASVRLALLGSLLGPELITQGHCLIASGPSGPVSAPRRRHCLPRDPEWFRGALHHGDGAH